MDSELQRLLNLHGMVEVVPSLTLLNVRELIGGCHWSPNDIRTSGFCEFEVMMLLKSVLVWFGLRLVFFGLEQRNGCVGEMMIWCWNGREREREREVGFLCFLKICPIGKGLKGKLRIWGE